MTQTFITRPCPSDGEAMAYIHGMCFDAPWTHAAFSDMIAHDYCLVAGAPISGFLIVREGGGEAEILTLAIYPNARRQNWATRLLSTAFDELANRGNDRLFLEVAADNAPAIGLYAGLAFVEVGRRKAYYTRPHEQFCDAIIMSRSLASTGKR